jgi:bacillithiol biosynthesis cysteine-adding enzyme BshC
MLKLQTTSFKHSGVLNKLLQDYLARRHELNPFYSAYPDFAGFEHVLKSNPYSNFNRERLSAILKAQSESVNNTSESAQAAIHRLSLPNAFTVTTGHQLCLFTGPLYFIYKIFSTINLAEELKTKFPDQEFVPVYWMATEDHDFEEINHFHINDETLRWESTAGGAVGDLSTQDLSALLPSLKKVLGQSANSKYLYELFEKAYLGHKNLALATRYLVNELFANYGLVILDGNDPEFKQQFISEMEEDLFQHTAFNDVNASSAALTTLGYHIQVNAREINLFYLEEGKRNRIELEGDQFRVLSTTHLFSAEEIRRQLNESPEKFSPNVVLRPLYQQKILPNLAYVGGPGELAYWLEFKQFFDQSDVHFPILMPRNFVTVLDQTAQKTLNKLGLKADDAFKSEQVLLKDIQIKLHDLFELTQEEAKLRDVFAELLARTQIIDKTLDGKVNAELQKTLNAIESIAAKANRAQRRKMEEQMAQIQKLKNAIYAGNVPRERHDNFAGYYLSFGPEFFKSIKAHANPLLLQHLMLMEEV